jgi:hypothetical protein
MCTCVGAAARFHNWAFCDGEAGPVVTKVKVLLQPQRIEKVRFSGAEVWSRMARG